MTQVSPGLCLIVDAHTEPAWPARVAAALDATRAATLIIAPGPGTPPDAAAAGALVRIAQARNVAALIADDWLAARALGADGVHLSPRDGLEDSYRAARAALPDGAIVGVDAGASRHDAMSLGEAGADYIAFGRAGDGGDGSEAGQWELVAWWSELFVVPVVAFGVESVEDVARLAGAEPDFIAVPLPGDGDVAVWAAAVRAAADAGSSAAPAGAAP